MKINKILIYGSAHLTAKTCSLLKHHYELVGHVPSVNPVIAGNMELPIVDDTIEHDIKLSLQYNRKMNNVKNAFNIHTGLLPDWGGQDILYHTLKLNSKEQGLTFHKMTSEYDYGQIISKITYPVLKNDTMIDLYNRMTCCFPGFVLSSLKLLESMSEKQVSSCIKIKPRLFNRGKIEKKDMDLYKKTLPTLREIYE